jgi:DNA-binding XRE family transcriptional regulator
LWESFCPKRLSQKKGEMMTLNPLSKLLKPFIRPFKMKQKQMAAKLGISRRSLYSAMNPDKDVDSFKVGFLKKMSTIFPITIVISRGKVRFFRWDTIIDDGFESE